MTCNVVTVSAHDWTVHLRLFSLFCMRDVDTASQETISGADCSESRCVEMTSSPSILHLMSLILVPDQGKHPKGLCVQTGISTIDSHPNICIKTYTVYKCIHIANSLWEERQASNSLAWTGLWGHSTSPPACMHLLKL